MMGPRTPDDDEYEGLVPIDEQLTRWCDDEDDEDGVIRVEPYDPCPQCGRPYDEHEAPIFEGRRTEEDVWTYKQRCDGRIVGYLE